MYVMRLLIFYSVLLVFYSSTTYSEYTVQIQRVPASAAQPKDPLIRQRFHQFQFHQRKEQCVGVVSVGEGKWLNVRSRASLGSDIVGGLENGQTVVIQSRTTGQNIEGNEIWYYIGFGYVAGAFIYLPTPGHPFWCLNYKW